MEKKIETTIMGYIRDYHVYVGVLLKMETTVMGHVLGFYWGFTHQYRLMQFSSLEYIGDSS